jgi:hypothetical protein
MNDRDGKKIITLVQKRGYTHNRDFDGLEEGDEYSGYVVDEVEIVDCDHPDRDWRVKGSDGAGGEVISGNCRICGHSVRKPVSEVDFE